MDKERLLKSAEKLDIKIEFDVDNPGVFDENSGSFYTFEELLGDILPSERTIEKSRINKNNEILLNNYKKNTVALNDEGYVLSKNEYKTESTKYNTLPKVHRWVA